MNGNPGLATMHVAIPAELRVSKADNRAWYRKAQTLVAATLSYDEGIYADHFAVNVYQWTAATSRINWRIGLDENHRTIGVRLACDCAHHAHCHRILQALGATESKNHLALPQLVVIA